MPTSRQRRDQGLTGAFEERIAGLFGGGGSDDDILSRAADAAGLYSETPDQRSPIGVPNDYVAKREHDMRGMSPTAVEGWNQREGWKPLYFDGDQFTPGNLDPGQIEELQRDLQEIGLLKPGYRKRVWDAESVEAYAMLLAYANQNGLTRDQALAKYKAGEMTVDPTEGPDPLVVREPNRLDVNAAIREASINMTGTGWDPRAIEAATNAYIAEVRRPQEQAYAMEVARYNAANGGEPAAGGTIVEPPSAQAFAEDYIRKQDPTGVQAEEGLGLLASIYQNINGWSG
jgi:hypothetical protein